MNFFVSLIKINFFCFLFCGFPFYILQILSKVSYSFMWGKIYVIRWGSYGWNRAIPYEMFRKPIKPYLLFFCSCYQVHYEWRIFQLIQLNWVHISMVMLNMILTYEVKHNIHIMYYNNTTKKKNIIQTWINTRVAKTPQKPKWIKGG